MTEPVPNLGGGTQMHARSLLLVTALLALAATLARGATVEYTTPTAGAVSVGIFDAQGRLLRTLQSGKKLEAGQQQIDWDGKDDLGKDLPPGPYTLKGLVANLGWEFQLEMGNSGKPPWLNADGSGGWGGAWGQVLDAAVDATGKDVYLLWKMEEGTPALIKVDPAGGVGKFKLWGAHDNWSWGNCQAVAADADYVYVANNMTATNPLGRNAGDICKSLLWRVRADSGEYAPYPGNNGGPVLLTTLPVASLGQLAPSWEMYAIPEKRRSPGFGVNFFGLAVDKTHLYCSLRAEGKLVILDKTTAATVKEVAIDVPGGMCLAPDGNLYLLSARNLVKISPDGAVLGTVIASGLDAPYGLCTDAAGNIYISDQGAAMQVKVFSPAGKLLRTVGKAGGRALGGEWARMKSDLLYPTGPAVTADGTLYVGEDCSPKRVAIFKQGRWADEWIGPLASGCNAIDIADEENPQYLYHLGVPNHLVRYKVDYAKKTFVVDAVWGYFNVADGRVKENDICHNPEGGGFIRHFQGKTFLCANGEFFRIDGYNLVPSARVGWRLVDRPNDDVLWRLAQTWASKPAKMGPYKPGGYAYQPIFHTWHDANGDGEVQENEVDFSTPADNNDAKHQYFAYSIHQYVAPDLTIYQYGYKIPCLGLDPRGNPIYSWSKAEPLVQRPMGVVADPQQASWVNTAALNVPYDAPRDLPGLQMAVGRMVSYWVDPDDGGLYQTCDVEGKGKGLGWASSGIFGRIGKMDKQGNWIWMAGTKATAFAKPGQFYKPAEFAGIVKGLLFFTDWNGQMRIWDKDTGLYAGSLFADGYRGPVPDENLISVEYNEAHAYLNRQNGLIYATGGDAEGLKLYRVTGVEQVARFSTTVTLGAVGPTAALPAAERPEAGWTLSELPGGNYSNLQRVQFVDPEHG